MAEMTRQDSVQDVSLDTTSRPLLVGGEGTLVADEPELIKNGRLGRLSDWNEDIAVLLATRDKLSLTSEHWEIIKLMRAYYFEYNISPIKKLLKKEIIEKLPAGDHKASDAYLDELFPNGVLVQGTKIAGLPMPMLDAEIETKTFPKIPSKTAELSSEIRNSFIEFEGKVYPILAKGNLADPADWSEDFAEFLARKENIVLTANHWEVIHYLRKFYFNYGITPMVRLLMKHMRRELGELKSSRDALYLLFPGGPSRQGSRIAGLPEPQGCIDD